MALTSTEKNEIEVMIRKRLETLWTIIQLNNLKTNC